MIGHYVLTLYRSLTRHPLYAALNVLGLAVGIAVFLVLMLDVRIETSFERWIPGASHIHIVRTTSFGEGNSPLGDDDTMGATLEELQGDYPGMVGARDWGQSVTIRQGDEVTAEHVEAVDPGFFRVFDLPLVIGDKTRLLRSPDEIILTQAKARQYFGAANPIGRPLTIVRDGQISTYRVSGVLKDLPRNTDLAIDFLVPLTAQMSSDQKHWRQWGSEQLKTYLWFDRPDQARALDADLDNFVDRHAGHDMPPPPAPHRQMTLRTAPLLSLHLYNPRDAAVVAAIGAMGLLTLLLAGVNYVNLATARAGLRAREVALRKVMGAGAASLIGQFMAEAMATAFLAAVIGLTLCELALPLVNAAGGLALTIDYLRADSILLPTLGAAIVVGLGAGVYPALVLSRFQPAAVLASARTPMGGRAGARVREGLVLIQFAIAIAFTVATAVIVSQTAFLRHADLGFRRDGLIEVANFDNSEVSGAQRADLLDAWRVLPGVSSASAADIAPGVQHTSNAYHMKRPGAPGEGPSIHSVQTQADFFQTYGARLIAGRLLDRNHGGDLAAPAAAEDAPVTHGPRTPVNVVVNAGAVAMLGFRGPADAVGRALIDTHRPLVFNIVGVIADVRFLSPHTPVEPSIYLLNPRDFDSQLAVIRYAGADPRAVIDTMEGQWRKLVPTVPFRARTIQDNLQHYYRDDEQHGRLFTLGAVLAVAIGCVGLYGLASFNTARRVREIGIRKTLGASAADVLRLLVGQFLRPVLLANLVAWPLAWLAMRSWLAGFDQRIALSPLYFLAATILTLIIAVGTVVGHALAVARAEPARALRHE